MFMNSVSHPDQKPALHVVKALHALRLILLVIVILLLLLLIIIIIILLLLTILLVIMVINDNDNNTQECVKGLDAYYEASAHVICLSSCQDK